MNFASVVVQNTRATDGFALSLMTQENLSKFGAVYSAKDFLDRSDQHLGQALPTGFTTIDTTNSNVILPKKLYEEKVRVTAQDDLTIRELREHIEQLQKHNKTQDAQIQQLTEQLERMKKNLKKALIAIADSL